MELEQLKEKLKDVSSTFNKLIDYGIVNGDLRAYKSNLPLEVWAVYTERKEQTKDPRVSIMVLDSGITLRVENKLSLTVTDEVRLATEMSLQETKDYLTDFFQTCDEANERMAIIELEKKRKSQQELDMGQDLLEIL